MLADTCVFSVSGSSEEFLRYSLACLVFYWCWTMLQWVYQWTPI